MALRENERRILAEIEHRLIEDDPELAESLASFASDAADSESVLRLGWKPWVVCGIIATVVITMLTVLFMLTPGPRPESAPGPASDTPGVVAPKSEPAG
ncbi:Protein of unknown function (DUF3040) [Murinocardiopsis flavida]|uniref:DUF3040 family protein n=1 Tax=Murinocardiopsis flavida TaxID=645275 RepID=A0A2P8DSC2_9ACTN|nr:DUF3040 domain-containing protein [Murinocardiopsis flavida]PSL00112.1 Protein of unknown function (DUF3040) [Murinocardiopsis flavida]